MREESSAPTATTQLLIDETEDELKSLKTSAVIAEGIGLVLTLGSDDGSQHFPLKPVIYNETVEVPVVEAEKTMATTLETLLTQSEEDLRNHNDQFAVNQHSPTAEKLGLVGEIGLINNKKEVNGTHLRQREGKKGARVVAYENGLLLESGNYDDDAQVKVKDHVDKDDLAQDDKSNADGGKRLLRIEDMPVHLQFNKYIHEGYREIQGVYGCVKSLSYFHNETVNILTHGLPIIYIIWSYAQMWPWDDTKHNIYFTFLGWAHIFGSVSPWVGSVVYHLFMNHHHGAKLYQALLQVDMLGIWVTQTFGALTNLTASTWCLPVLLQMTWMTIYAFASFYGLYKALTAWSPMARRLCFTGVFLSRILGFFVRISTWGGGNPDILIHVILQDVISVSGGMIGVIRIPEKWFPGKLDMFCNSHHIMHVLVVWAVFHMNAASNGDMRWILDNHDRSQCAALY